MKKNERETIDWDEYWRATVACTGRVVTSRLDLAAAATPTGEPVPFPQDETGAPRNLSGRHRVFVRNNAVEVPLPPSLAEVVFIGGPGVDPSQGYPLTPQEMIELAVTDRIQLYVAKNSTQSPIDLRTMEIG